MIDKIRCIDYNILMTLIKLFSDKIPDITSLYNLNNISIDILPSYPRDLSKFNKPSIIIQKVATTQGAIAFGNFIGQNYDTNTNTYMDVYGNETNITSQIDIVCDNNTHRSIFKSIISDDILNEIVICNHGIIDILDFIDDIENPVKIGECKLINDFDMVDTQTSQNYDYISFIRFDISIIQCIVPQDKYIDLSKIQIKHTINI